MVRKIYVVICALFFGFVGFASGAGIGDVHIEWVAVGDPGNPENTVPKLGDGSTGYGSVAESFRIAKYEVTNNQYVSFLNAIAASDPNGLYRTEMGTKLEGGILRSGSAGNYTYSAKTYFGNKPVNYTSFYDSARFANWLQNGQPTGGQTALTTEDGAYTFGGAETVSARNLGAQIYVPNENQWQKAAFYEPGAITNYGNAGLGDGWWRYPGQSDVKPSFAAVDATGNVTNPGPNVVNARERLPNGTLVTLNNWNGSTLGNVVTVGSAGSQSYYGAYDMTGNVTEWVEADPTQPDLNGWGPYATVGGSFASIGHIYLEERNLSHHVNHNVEKKYNGIRLAAAAITVVPEPSSFALVSITTFVALTRGRRKRRPQVFQTKQDGANF